jgi:hypothetical protein
MIISFVQVGEAEGRADLFSTLTFFLNSPDFRQLHPRRGGATGSTLITPVQALFQWTLEHCSEVEAARIHYDRRMGGEVATGSWSEFVPPAALS